MDGSQGEGLAGQQAVDGRLPKGKRFSGVGKGGTLSVQRLQSAMMGGDKLH